MNAIYSGRSPNVWLAKRLACQTFSLLKVKGLAFIPLKVRLLLFKNIIFLLSSLYEKERGRVSSVRYCLRLLIG